MQFGSVAVRAGGDAAAAALGDASGGARRGFRLRFRFARRAVEWVRGLQSHRTKLEAIPAGTRTAVNLGGLAVEDLRRGQVLISPGMLQPTRALDARLRLIRDARPVRHNAEVTFHLE